MTTIKLHYPTVAAMVSDCSAPFTMSGNAADALRYTMKNECKTGEDVKQWYGMTEGVDGVKRAIVGGFPESEDAMRHMMEELKVTLPRALGHNRAKHRGMFGDEVDVHAMNRGNFDRAWTRSTRQIKQGSGILRLCIDIGGNASQSAEGMRWRGIAGIALAQVMEKAGYAVEIVGCFACSMIARNVDCVVSYIAKPHNSRADLGFLAATVALTGFFRTYGFAQIARAADNAGELVFKNLGHYMDPSGVMDAPEKVMQLMVSPRIDDRESAISWVRESVGLLQHSTMSKERG
jgi:hypothetical protein